MLYRERERMAVNFSFFFLPSTLVPGQFAGQSFAKELEKPEVMISVE